MKLTSLSILILILLVVSISGCTTGINDIRVSSPVFEPSSGEYVVDDGLDVSIKTDNPDAIIYYTTNGLEPNDNAEIFESPINIRESTVIHAIAYVEGMLPSRISSAKYDLISKTEFEECEETDGGKDYYKKGVTKTSKESKEDICKQGNNYNLIEYYCSKDMNSSKVIIADGYQCPSGCSEGACISGPKYLGPPIKSG